MRKPSLTVAIIACTGAVYAAIILIGTHLSPSALSRLDIWPAPLKSRIWHPTPTPSTVAYGQALFNETPVYAARYTQSRIACANCHLQGGIAPYASPVVGIVPSFPWYSKRNGRRITLEERIQECMTRSENGQPLPHDGPEMRALLAYINRLSEPHTTEAKFIGRGLEPLPILTPDPIHGARIYASQCAGCHGTNGEGTRRPFPPLWGPNAFNDGAGMNTIEKMAPFIHYNMPQNRKGILSVQDSYDVAAFIHAQPRPAYNHAYDRF
ncbi:thiosulfate dehydrogenase [Granulicella pectinivorans]|jgi:thiosulfate dehydrogenase|uniref:Thiosulfate dehydrogenase n=1 Tax=Granulicella pectinivorans TaxID=474950 RepID=A0A1I6MSX6_9BACT|nr:c-type cytochrome [Granulicella pectinivorans]SFS18747.1 thiosulfate dehydrogenase [Granulicella pectinivorans]